MAPRLPSVTNVSHVPSAALLRVAHDFYLEHAETVVASLNHDAEGLELPGATDDPFAFWSPERVDQLHEEVGSVLADGKEWSVHSFLYAAYTILIVVSGRRQSTLQDPLLPNALQTGKHHLIPQLAATLPGYGSLVFEDPMVEISPPLCGHDNGTGFGGNEERKTVFAV